MSGEINNDKIFVDGLTEKLIEGRLDILQRCVFVEQHFRSAFLEAAAGWKPGDRVTNAEKTYVMVKWHRYWGIESKPWMRAKLVKKSGELSEKASTLYSWEKQGSK